MRLLSRLPLIVRSSISGGVATIADLALLTLLVVLFHVPAKLANIPSLLVGSVVQFVGQRTFAFRTVRQKLAPEIAGYVLVESLALLFNAGLFAWAMSALPAPWRLPALIRLATCAIVWLAFSFPMSRRVFRARRA